jgi:hypothetical protein
MWIFLKGVKVVNIFEGERGRNVEGKKGRGGDIWILFIFVLIAAKFVYYENFQIS